MADLNSYFVTVDVYGYDESLMHSHTNVPIHSIFSVVSNWNWYGAAKITITDHNSVSKTITL